MPLEFVIKLFGIISLVLLVRNLCIMQKFEEVDFYTYNL